VLQAAFFAVTGMIPPETALAAMKDAAKTTYFAKGDEVVAQNIAAIEAGAAEATEIPVPASWATLPDDAPADESDLPPVVRNLLMPQPPEGRRSPGQRLRGYEDGGIDVGLTAYEKRGIAVRVPQWDASKCVQ
jgi:pyruvate-ferredoxin/flavodoxin oxidoreductase